MPKVSKKRATAAILGRLIELKQTIERLKGVYGEYDELLEIAIAEGDLPPTVRYQGVEWRLLLVDLFETKNTAWKSVAQRRYDLEISRQQNDASIFKVARRAKR